MQKYKFILATGSRIGVHNGQKGIADDRGRRKQVDHIVSHKNQRKRKEER